MFQSKSSSRKIPSYSFIANLVVFFFSKIVKREASVSIFKKMKAYEISRSIRTIAFKCALFFSCITKKRRV